MPKCITLVGLPGSGKTTWRNSFLKSVAVGTYWEVISMDDEIERVMDGRLTYKEAFDAIKDEYSTLVAGKLAAAKLHGFNVIWDQTNVTKKKRQIIRNALPSHAHYVVNFLDVPLTDILSRNEARKATGRNIPDDVLKLMIENANAEFDNTITELPRSLSFNMGEFYD